MLGRRTMLVRQITLAIPGHDVLTFPLKKEILQERKKSIREVRSLHMVATELLAGLEPTQTQEEQVTDAIDLWIQDPELAVDCDQWMADFEL